MQKLNLARIKELRKKRKYSQADMAEVLGLSSMWIYHRKERGDQSFTAEELNALMKFFEKDHEYFFENVVA
ncbi:helix-turn-helix transcriptional regulator [Psychrobacillus sp. FSL K6-4615]|uniref:helix-turn-helix transcriptional regulator n=1 Tax=Psychrobacillus sp. FSL K6-4615 TaxID=2921551 RepID=UPI0030F80979